LLTHKVLSSKVNEYLDPNTNKYNGLIRIIDSDFLILCKRLIKGNIINKEPQDTLDNMVRKPFEKMAKDIIDGRWKPCPARIHKTLGANSATEYQVLLTFRVQEKIVQKALTLILTAVFDRTFSDSSHGFRPGRSVGTALDKLHMRGGHMAWVIKGDINKSVENVSHEKILCALKEKVSCVRLLTLVERILKAGYIDEKGLKISTHLRTNKAGTPQGCEISGLLCNIVLDKMDKFIESKELNVGDLRIKRKYNPLYIRLENRRKYYKHRNPVIAKKALLEMRKIPKFDTLDEGFTRALYVRYADAFVVLLANTRDAAERLKTEIGAMLKEQCGLELNLEKTSVQNTKKGFEFLGASLKRRDNSSIFNSFNVKGSSAKISRRSTLRLAVDMPVEKLINKLIDAKFARRNKHNTVLAQGLTSLVQNSHYNIVRFYNSKIWGLHNAYSYAGNFSSMNKICWILRQSCALTLARKFKLRTMKKAFSAYGFDLKDPISGLGLAIPQSFKATHDFKRDLTKNGLQLDDHTHKILNSLWITKGRSSKR